VTRGVKRLRERADPAKVHSVDSGTSVSAAGIPVLEVRGPDAVTDLSRTYNTSDGPNSKSPRPPAAGAEIRRVSRPVGDRPARWRGVTAVLLVEDDPAIRRLVRADLERRDMVVAEAGTVAAAVAALRAQIFDVVILDVSLPDGSGLDVVAHIRSEGGTEHVIMLSGAGTEVDRIRGLDSGADDYVVKPFFARELTARVVAVTRRRTAEQATVLRLGGLEVDLAARRALVDDVLIDLTAKEFSLLAFLAARPGHVFSRDELLRAVWQSDPDWQTTTTVTEHIRRLRGKLEVDPARPQLLQTVRGVGYSMARPAEADAAAAELFESVRLRRLVTGVLSEVTDAVIVTDPDEHISSWNGAAERLYGWGEREVLGRHLLDIVPWLGADDVAASVHAELDRTGRWQGELRQRTRDDAVITVRATTNVVRDEEGRRMATVSVNRQVHPERERLQREPNADEVIDLRRGLDDGELDVFYQPVVALADRRLVTVEALVRWRHATRGVLEPDDFIETAERSGLIVELGAFVLGEACRRAASWRRAGVDVNLAVNLSARELADPRLVERVSAVIAASGLEPTSLWLEVTESALVEDVDQASAMLHQLSALGIGISIDDFGTGWASLTYLRRFPVHLLKIDRSFVTGVDHDPSNAAIVRSILSLGAELGLDVVAEGIETAAEDEALQALGCSIGQGYLYGRPVPGDEIDLARADRIAPR
jgi:PAS domain S-box-containing protein